MLNVSMAITLSILMQSISHGFWNMCWNVGTCFKTNCRFAICFKLTNFLEKTQTSFHGFLWANQQILKPNEEIIINLQYIEVLITISLRSTTNSDPEKESKSGKDTLTNNNITFPRDSSYSLQRNDNKEYSIIISI